MKHFIYRASFLVLLICFTACNSSGKKEKEESITTIQIANNPIKISHEQFMGSEMQLGGIQVKSFPTIVRASGMIDVPPENKVVVNATMGGYIKTTPFLIGDLVKKGQTLVTIENPEFVTMQQKYLEVKEKMAYLKSENERQKILLNENITSQKNYLKAESEYKTALANYNGLRKQLTMLNISISDIESGTITSIAAIHAPISGSITKVNVTRGMFVSPASPILEIIDNEHIHLELSVFEKDIMSIKKEQSIQFKIPEASDATFEANVYLVGTAIEENRTIKVHGHLKDEADHNFLTGMFVDASIIINDSREQSLPTEAIVMVNEVPHVLVLDSKNGNDYFFKPMEVQIGKNQNGYTSIKDTGKFDTSVQFLTKGAFNLIGE